MAKVITLSIQDKKIQIDLDVNKDGQSSAQIIAQGNLAEAAEELLYAVKNLLKKGKK